MITYKNQPIPLSTVAKVIAKLFVFIGKYEIDSPEYKANVDYIQENPEYAIKLMFKNTIPNDFGLSFDNWESLEDFEINKGEKNGKSRKNSSINNKWDGFKCI